LHFSVENRKRISDDFWRVRYGLRDLSQEEVSTAFAKTVNPDFKPTFGSSHLGSKFSVGISACPKRNTFSFSKSFKLP
jgi:hypothetical protein